MHKNRFGHVFVLAGSPSMLGAAALTALAAMRSGAGLVTAGIPKSLNLTLQKKISPVIMTMPLPETRARVLAPAALSSIRKICSRFQVIAVGPGLGQDPPTQRFVRKLVASGFCPMVIDADGLNAIAGHLKVLKERTSVKILTPHPGEMARLANIDVAAVEKNRVGIARTFAKAWRCVLVLKGHRTVVASPDGKTYVNTTGNPGLAKAGSGDVLTGIVAAFLAQGLDPFVAARTAVFIHGKAADLAAVRKTRTGLLATDLIDALPSAFR